MSNMFNRASSFNQPLDAWNISSVKDIQGMFQYAIAFNQPLDSWDFSQVSLSHSIFRGADQFSYSKKLRKKWPKHIK